MSLDLGPQCSAGNNEAETHTAVEISALLYKTYAAKLSQYLETEDENNDVEFDKLLENCGFKKNEITKKLFIQEIRAFEPTVKKIESNLKAFNSIIEKHKDDVKSHEGK